VYNWWVIWLCKLNVWFKDELYKDVLFENIWFKDVLYEDVWFKDEYEY
jgi:hypothetical protein